MLIPSRRILVYLFFIIIILPLTGTSYAFQNPTQDDQNFYDAIKARFTNNKQFGQPNPANPSDPRIDVSEVVSTENNPKLIATKNCPAGSPVQKVEIYATFRLVQWNSTNAGDHVGFWGPESIDREITNNTKKLTYHFYVMFDHDTLNGNENDKMGKWDNARVFYHEMMHGQLTYNRMKDPNWSGWAIACRCQTPNPGYIAKGVNTEAYEHSLMTPAEDKFLTEVLKSKENMNVTIFTTTGISGAKDVNGNRPFTKVIPIPPEFLQKENMNVTTQYNRSVIGEPKIEINSTSGTVTIKGNVTDNQTGHIVVGIDPPSFGVMIYLTEYPFQIIPSNSSSLLPYFDSNSIQITMINATIANSTAIPEFGPISVLILTISIISVIVFSVKIKPVKF